MSKALYEHRRHTGCVRKLGRAKPWRDRSWSSSRPDRLSLARYGGRQSLQGWSLPVNFLITWTLFPHFLNLFLLSGNRSIVGCHTHLGLQPLNDWKINSTPTRPCLWIFSYKSLMPFVEVMEPLRGTARVCHWEPALWVYNPAPPPVQFLSLFSVWGSWSPWQLPCLSQGFPVHHRLYAGIVSQYNINPSFRMSRGSTESHRYRSLCQRRGTLLWRTCPYWFSQECGTLKFELEKWLSVVSRAQQALLRRPLMAAVLRMNVDRRLVINVCEGREDFNCNWTGLEGHQGNILAKNLAVFWLCPKTF